MVVATNSEKFASPRGARATIRFLKPHKAIVSGSAARCLTQFTLDSHIEAERRIALGVCSGAVKFGRGSADIEGGYVNAVKIALEYRGFVVDVVEAHWGNYTMPYELSDLAWYQSWFVGCLAGRGRALVADRSFDVQLELLEVFCKRFPTASISVAVEDMGAALFAAALLSGRVPQQMHSGTRGTLDNTPQVNVQPVGNFVPRSPRDYFVALGEAATLNREVHEKVALWPNCIRVAITNAPLQTVRERDRVYAEAMFGPCLLDFSNPPPFSPVFAAVVPSAGSRVEEDLRGLERKRRHITQNFRRNEQIAQIAQRLRRRDATCMRAAGIEDLHHIFPEPAEPNRLRVAIVVGSPHHAQELQRHLPAWRVVTDLSSVGPLGIQPDAAIVTLPVACAVGLHTEVIVYAAGTGDRWGDECGGRISLTSSMQLVVDFADDFDRMAEAEICRRVEDYRRRNWIICWRGHDGRPPFEASDAEL